MECFNFSPPLDPAASNYRRQICAEKRSQIFSLPPPFFGSRCPSSLTGKRREGKNAIRDRKSSFVEEEGEGRITADTKGGSGARVGGGGGGFQCL